MIYFNEKSNIGLGSVSPYPFHLYGYCFHNGYLILSLFHGDYYCKLMAVDVNSTSGVMTITDTIDVQNGNCYGVYSDGTYLYHHQITTVGNYRRVYVYTFNGSAFSYVTYYDNLFGFGDRQMTFGDGYIFMTQYSPSRIVAASFNGSTFTIHHTTDELTASNEAPLFYINGRLFGLQWYETPWSFKRRVLTYNISTGFSVEYTDPDYEWYGNVQMQSFLQCLWNDKLYEYTGSQYILKHTLENTIGQSYPYFGSNGLLGGASYGTYAGLHLYIASSPYTYWGLYKPGVTCQRYFTFKGFDFFVFSEKIGDEYVLRNGIFSFAESGAGMYLNELQPKRRYDRFDYLKALRALLPRGDGWLIPLPDEQDIQLYGIESEEAFGQPTVSN